MPGARGTRRSRRETGERAGLVLAIGAARGTMRA
jgi:hypothetical protein